MNTKIILEYLSALSRNNNREWYHEHKEEFQKANALPLLDNRFPFFTIVRDIIPYHCRCFFEHICKQASAHKGLIVWFYGNGAFPHDKTFQ